MPARFSFSSWLFLRLLAVVYLIAFVSYWTQAPGLVGANGILPAQDYFAAAQTQLGHSAWRLLPSLAWIVGANHLGILCAAGVACAVLLFVGIVPAYSLFVLWACYLSVCVAGQDFYGFQWDSLLLEATLPALFLAPWSALPLWKRADPPRLARWLLWWLLFRLMTFSGVVKLLSGDPSWTGLTALTFHYETQPLPTPVSWYMHQLPAWFQVSSCVVMFVIELAMPLAIFAGRRLRHIAALSIIALMAVIAITGNYTFFNLLTIALAVLWLDDAWWARVLRRPVQPDNPSLRSAHPGVVRIFAGAVIVYSIVVALPRLTRSNAVAQWIAPVNVWVSPFRSINSYGLFARMTNPRPELIFEGSDDGEHWLAYELPDKPGKLTRRSGWVAPFQPRLDWQLWFAALAPPEYNRWTERVCERLLRGTPEVLALFAENPFPTHPPRIIRVLRYEYHFTDPTTHLATGAWWRRRFTDVYIQPVSLVD